VLGLVLPCHSDPRDAADAQLAAATFGLQVRTVDLTPVYDAFVRALDAAGEQDSLPLANVKPRLRMITLYYHAGRLNRLVVGTGNRSELEVGYFTKYGDGGVDLLPLGGFVKEEVRALARYIGVPERVISRQPTAGLWQGQTDEGEMGFSYAELDRYLTTGEAEAELAARIERLRRQSEHKRRLPAVFQP
jgi:NAD+ synthase